jgi:hypothetical protein
MSIHTHPSIDGHLSRIVELWAAANPGAPQDERWERRRARFASAWAGLREYRIYVDFALEHREQASAEFLRSVEDHRRLLLSGDARGRTHAELFDERLRLIPLVHYEIKCVHVFGKIVLDRVAVAIRETFGAHNAPPLERHVHVWKETEGGGLRAYAVSRGIPSPPDDLIDRAARLETATRFRDEQITHIANVRFAHGAQFNPQTGEVDVGVGVQVPTESELERLEAGSFDGPPVAQFVQDVDEYIAVVLSWIEDCFSAGASPTG